MERTATTGARRVIAVDGKALGGSRSEEGGAPIAHATGSVVGQPCIADKTSEIAALREVL